MCWFKGAFLHSAFIIFASLISSTDSFGVEQCGFLGHYAGDWKMLHCIAKVESRYGQIQCYQGGMRMPHLSAPSYQYNTLEQTILVQQNHHLVFCCSSQLREPKERCDCNDFVWHPLSKGKELNPGNPCSITTRVSTALLSTSYHDDHFSPIEIAKIHEQARLEREQAEMELEEAFYEVAGGIIILMFYVIIIIAIIVIIIVIIICIILILVVFIYVVTKRIIILVCTIAPHLLHFLNTQQIK